MARGLMTDEGWAVFAPFLIENRSRGGRPPADHRRVLDAVYWIARTGSPWRDPPLEFGNWNSVFRQYRFFGFVQIATIGTWIRFVHTA